MKKKNIIIIGAAGRDFHNFNQCRMIYTVVAFPLHQYRYGYQYPADWKFISDGFPSTPR